MKVLEQFNALNEHDRQALDEVIMDKRITDFPSLVEAFNEAKTFLDEQPGAKLSFKQFQATKRAVTWTPERSLAEGYEAEEMEVLEYAENCYVECCPDSMYHLTIGNLDWFMPNLETLEELLYDKWYL